MAKRASRKSSSRAKKVKTGNGVNLGFEAPLWAVADDTSVTRPIAAE